ncbi:PAS domain S-box-containing protein [Alteribacillus persepolensis]|uniref:PAS domain S-box-containing protein n=1 Tax=Alteribacillus persepolensis TaxID=568899 RepID=A0A1G8JBH8_9BACI|nr:sigma 54-interacting transcriptional regulator [Alteribacillus persepolensis]SDI28442.1 PAS domain S-box-containing protein [Alteribacillus persepolensis]
MEYFGKYSKQIIETILEKSDYWFVVVDENGLITYLGENYSEFLGIDRAKAIGKPVQDIIENTRMHIVVQTGKEETADLQYIRGNHMIASRTPVWADGKVVGAVGTVLYRDPQELMNMNSQVKDFLLQMDYYRKQLESQNGATYSLHDVVGSSAALNQVKEKIKKVASGDVSVLLRGESGTGKELFAHSIHQLSERHTKPFVKVNCAAIPDHLLESELFGYEEGAFTGAQKGGKPGKFQLAHGGTLFLDEIGDMPKDAQVKILRSLQEGEVERIGSVTPEKVDVRIITATNQPLEKLIEENRFREDLFYRINVIQIEIPPLRTRPEDIRITAKYMLHHITNRTGKRVVDFNSEVIDFFTAYSWPGNVRELENVIESAVHLTNTEIITKEDLPEHLQPTASPAPVQRGSLKEILERTERQAILQALQETNGNKLEAAAKLNIGKSSFYDKVKKYRL